ncbi:DNA repair protein RadA [Candidatus Marinimicrobia bacterium]|jgi:DNA repair protein RadA/Sms|nr:DNA repair protein RadA [Candidatus Neomarinimicrobiota bacterium]MDC0631109.1 DNA repair protein RadA [Candidatus Neomarinimicrobiota bacterium]
MPSKKSKTAYLCSACGNDFPKWNGQCFSCKEWGTLAEFKVSKSKNSRTFQPRDTKSLKDILSKEPEARIPSGLKEADRVLGGGLLPGSLILLGGNPGVGKSTLALHVCSGSQKKVLYVSAEESEEQVALRARRIKVDHDKLFLSSENELDGIINHIDRVEPDLVVIDSIQTIMNTGLDSLPGSPSQIRDCGQRLLEISKYKNVTILIVGHVTKEGTIAGPKMLEHMVDTVLYMEGDDRYDHRILRAAKNRFGATHEVGIFQMDESGLKEVTNPSEMFLAERSVNIAGTTIYPSLEGTRPILVEVQALVTNANYGNPQRNVNGFDFKRLGMLIAVLEKRMGLAMGTKDVYVNLVGGLKVDDPAADLSIICSIASSTMDKPIGDNIILCGEVGLAGEIRSINRLEQRLNEAATLGFKKAIIPKSNLNDRIKKIDIQIHAAQSVKDAFKALF